MKKHILFIVALIAALVLAGCGNKESTQSQPSPSASGAPSESASPEASASAPAQKFGKIKVAYPTQASDVLPLWVGLDNGIFEKYGLDIEPVPRRSCKRFWAGA